MLCSYVYFFLVSLAISLLLDCPSSITWNLIEYVLGKFPSVLGPIHLVHSGFLTWIMKMRLSSRWQLQIVVKHFYGSYLWANIWLYDYLQNINDIRKGRKTKTPIFDLETGARSGLKELIVSEDCGVVCLDDPYRLLPCLFLI